MTSRANPIVDWYELANVGHENFITWDLFRAAIDRAASYPIPYRSMQSDLPKRTSNLPEGSTVRLSAYCSNCGYEQLLDLNTTWLHDGDYRRKCDQCGIEMFGSVFAPGLEVPVPTRATKETHRKTVGV